MTFPAPPGGVTKEIVSQTPARRYQRREIAAPLAVLVRGHLLHGLTTNIGEGGLGAALPRAVAIGEKVIVSLELLDLVILASVRYHDGFLHGLEFHLIGPRQQTLLKELCGANTVHSSR